MLSVDDVKKFLITISRNEKFERLGKERLNFSYPPNLQFVKLYEHLT